VFDELENPVGEEVKPGVDEIGVQPEGGDATEEGLRKGRRKGGREGGKGGKGGREGRERKGGQTEKKRG
jgi:hypothetical protein